MANFPAIAVQQHDADAVVPEAEVDLSQGGLEASARCQKIWAKGKREKYAKKCVEGEYKQIPCPVLRALMGSGFLEWLPGTVTPRSGLMKVLDGVVGASASMLPVFEGAVHGATDDY